MKTILTIIFISVLGFCNYGQITSSQFKRNDGWYNLNEELSGTFTSVEASVKLFPEGNDPKCNENNYIGIKIEGNLSNTSQYITFEIQYFDCNQILYEKTFSIPLSRNELIKIGIDPNMLGPNGSNSTVSQILGQNPSNYYNSDYLFKTTKPEKTINVRVTNTYEGGRTRKVEIFKNPDKVIAINENNKENTRYQRASPGSVLKLSLDGGTLPPGGKWLWYYNNNQINVSGTGNEAELKVGLINNFAELEVSVCGATADLKNKSDLVKRKIYIEVKPEIFKKVDELLKKDNYEEAIKIIDDIKKSYPYDYEIEQKLKSINDQKLAKEEQEKRRRLEKFLNEEYDIAYHFPQINSKIKSKIQDLINSNIYKIPSLEGKQKFSIGAEYSRNSKYSFSIENLYFLNSKPFSESIITGLNDFKYNLDVPSKTFENQLYKVDASGNYLVDLDINSDYYKVKKKDKLWVIDDQNISGIMNYRYVSNLNLYPDGIYNVIIKTVKLNNKNFYHISGECIRRKDGVSNVFKSMVLPGSGRKGVGLNHSITYSVAFLTFTGISIGSKLYSDEIYKKFQSANDQTTLENYYNIANFSNRLALVTGAISVSLYFYDIISVLGKGIKNKHDPNLNTHLIVSQDNIIYN